MVATAAAFLLDSASGAGSSPASPPSAQRIVSLSPHVTELLFAVGAGDQLVGVDDASDYPPAARRLPKVGEASALDFEALVKLTPTLVITWKTGTPARLQSEFATLHLPVIVTEQRRLADIGDALAEFGALTGHAAAGEEAAGDFRGRVARLRTAFGGRRVMSVFFQIWDRPLYTLSGDHVVSEVLSLCGGKNVFADLKTLAPAVEREAVLARDPDVILIGGSGAEAARQAAEWGRFTSMRAVRKRHIYPIDATLISRMAPRILDAVPEVCAAIEAARR